MLQILFGDDEHTASDGAYTRLMKARKWLYLSSALGFISAHELYRQSALEGLVKVVGVPTWLVHNSALVGTSYLLAQYVLLLAQLSSSYDLTLKSRFAFRKADDAAAAAERLSAAEKRMKEARESLDPDRAGDLNEFYEAFRRWDDRVKIYQKHLDVLTKQRKRPELRGDAEALAKHDAEIARAQRALKRAQNGMERSMARLRQSRNSYVHFSPEQRDIEDEYVKAQQAYAALRREDPAARWLYRASEVAIDIARLIPPAAAGVFSLILLWKAA